MEHVWEQLDENTWRCQVLGGWVMKMIHREGKAFSVSSVFIADKHGEWAIIPKMEEVKVNEGNNLSGKPLTAY